MTDTRRGGVVIPDRPQISVEEEGGILTIAVASIGEGFDSVEIKEVTMPMDCAQEVAQAILALVGR